MAHIIVETHSQEYNVYFRTMREMLATPIQWVLEHRKIFVLEFSGVATIWLAHVMVETHF